MFQGGSEEQSGRMGVQSSLGFFGYPTGHVTDLPLVFAVRLLPPFNLQEGRVILIENMFCNLLYGQITGKGNTYSVHEDMVCAGDFSTGKSICQVSKPFLLFPCLFSWPQFPQWGLCCLCSLCGDPWTYQEENPCFLPLCVFPGLQPSEISTRLPPSPSQHDHFFWTDPQAASIFVTYFKHFYCSIMYIHKST